MILILCSLAHAEILFNVDWSPSGRGDLFLSVDETIHPLSEQAQLITGPLQPWMGWSNKEWTVLGTLNYQISETRSYAGDTVDVQNVGGFHFGTQVHRHFWRNDFSVYLGLGMTTTRPIVNRASNSFTEEEQAEYDQQQAEIASTIKHTTIFLPIGIQYWITDGIYVGFRQDFSNSLSLWTSETIGSQLTTRYFTDAQIQVGCFF